ncbi:MAG: hypothetical protein MNPFHGCM_02353 [Gemmatimonadaceae bacterium]|nr:hypothetical protein [Gemmatimonadaceae bacterium]
MHVILKLHGVIVGHADLTVRDAVLGLWRGPFRPGLGWELIEPVFDLKSEIAPGAAERFEQARNALRFELTTNDGTALALDGLDIGTERRGEQTVPVELFVRFTRADV